MAATMATSDFHKEELRSRLYLIRQSLLRQTENDDYHRVQQVFTDSVFREVCEVLDVVRKIPDSSLVHVVTECFRQN